MTAGDVKKRQETLKNTGNEEEVVTFTGTLVKGDREALKGVREAFSPKLHHYV